MDDRADLTGPWLDDLSYDRLSGALVRAGTPEVDFHPFAPELRSIFSPQHATAGAAVYCIDEVPTVCLIDQRTLDPEGSERGRQIRAFCERLWNQNLARVVLVTSDRSLEAWSVDNPKAAPQHYTLEQRDLARQDWSVAGLLGGDALRGRDKWFDPHKRVDKVLLDNVVVLVARLADCGLDPAGARRLVARLIFITYLEDREIVGQAYRETRRVRPLFELVRDHDRAGLRRLIQNLRSDFNGDFLTSADSEAGWENLSAEAFSWILGFLNRTTLRSGQSSFWRYDFSQIPIELIASIYETFLATKDVSSDQPASERQKRKQGAYYTPRLLADWVVDLAFADRDVLTETIFDGACGSGMLLTSAYRRLVRAHEVHRARIGLSPEADFTTRRQLLVERVFGGDIDEDACQLTAFSLYLALLSDLSPRDLAELRRGGHKLPTLSANIRRREEGDFFSAASEQANRGRFGIFLSNPPWRKLRAGEAAAKSLSAWRQRQPEPRPRIPKQQIAAGFALAAADTVRAGGRVAMILPVTLFTSADAAQRDFRTHLLGRYRIDKIVNFSDMRRLIFADAVHPFVVLLATVRAREERFASVEAEAFEYWTPKTDISLAFGRLAVHGGDRADLPASALLDDQPQLTLRYWGSDPDVALLERLRRRGTIRDLLKAGWQDAKGFHASDEDRRRDPSTWYRAVPDWMAEARFLHAQALPSDLPFVPCKQLQAMPFERIARVPHQRLFQGPRVIWPDGTHPEGGVKAVYAEAPFSFQHSLAVLSAPATEEGRLTARFLTAYLRSPLGLWLLLLLSGSVASERPKLHLAEALDWPFWPLSDHPQPERAKAILIEVDDLIARAESAEELFQSHVWDSLRHQANSLIYGYFQLSSSEVAMIEELAAMAGEALQPTSLRHRALNRSLRRAPSPSMLAGYADALTQTLCGWRDATGGVGDIHVGTWTGRSVPVGAAVLTLGIEHAADRLADDGIVQILADSLRRVAAQPGEDLLTVPDLSIVDGDKIFLVKPLVSRFWMRRRAVEDANRLALQFQALSKARLPA